MFHKQNFKRVFLKQQNTKLLISSMQPFNYEPCQLLHQREVIGFQVQ